MKYELTTVGEHFKLIKGISYTSADLAHDSETGLLTINAFHPGGGFKLNSEKPFIGKVRPDYLLSDGDVLIAMTEQDEGLLASPLLIKSEHSPFVQLTYSLDVAKVVSRNTGMDAKFLYNLLRIQAFRIRAAYGDAGSTVQRLPYEALAELKIPKPPLSKQRAIAAVIDEIDEQIHLNNALARTIEEVVNTIFKSWFIDYDPMHAHLSHQLLAWLDKEGSSLFPTSMQDSEIGEIPSGWSVTKVENLLERLKYRSPFKSSENHSTGEIPIVQQGEPMIAGYTDSTKVIEASKVNPVFVFGDHTCRMKLMVEPFVALPNTIPLKASNGFTYWAYHATRGLQEFESYRRHWMELAIRNVAVPPTALMQHFEDFAASCWWQIANLQRRAKISSDLLAEMIPQLVTGDIEIPEELLGE